MIYGERAVNLVTTTTATLPIYALTCHFFSLLSVESDITSDMPKHQTCPNIRQRCHYIRRVKMSDMSKESNMFKHQTCSIQPLLFLPNDYTFSCSPQYNVGGNEPSLDGWIQTQNRGRYLTSLSLVNENKTRYILGFEEKYFFFGFLSQPIFFNHYA